MTIEKAREIAEKLSYSLGVNVYIIEDGLGFGVAVSPIGPNVKIVEEVRRLSSATPNHGGHGRFSDRSPAA